MTNSGGGSWGLPKAAQRRFSLQSVGNQGPRVEDKGPPEMKAGDGIRSSGCYCPSSVKIKQSNKRSEITYPEVAWSRAKYR